MTLLDFLNSIPIDERDSFAARCETTFDYLRQVAYGNRPCREKLAMHLERESEGKLTCEMLCPDAPWHVIRCMPAPTKFGRRSTDKKT